MICIEREIESTKIKATITKDHGIELEVIPGIGAFAAEKSIGRLFQISCKNKDLCMVSSAGLDNPKILEAMLKFAPLTVGYDGYRIATIKYASSFYGVDTSLCLFAIRLRKPKICINDASEPRSPNGLEIK